MRKCQKRPIYIFGKRDLSYTQKRPTNTIAYLRYAYAHVSTETSKRALYPRTRDLNNGQKKPTSKQKEAYEYTSIPEHRE